MKLPSIFKREGVSGLDFQSNLIKPIAPFLISFLTGFTLLLFFVSSNTEFIKTPLGATIFFLLYVGDIGFSAGIMLFIRAIMTEKGNRLKLIMATLKWALNNTPTCTLFFFDPEPKGKIKTDTKNKDLKSLVDDFLKRMKGEKTEPTAKTANEDCDDPPPKTSEADNDYVYVTKVQLVSQEIGWDDQAQTERPFQHLYIYTPGAPFTKHFPQEQTIEVPFGFSIINHGHGDYGSLDCVSWQYDPIEEEWIPHCVVTDSVWYSIALRKAFKLPKVNESILAMSYCKQVADAALGIKTDLVVAEEELENQLRRKPEKIRKYLDQEREADLRKEKRILTPEDYEAKPSMLKWVVLGAVVIVALVFVTKLAGMW